MTITKMLFIESTNIQTIGYSGADLLVTFHAAPMKLYRYTGAAKLYNELIDAHRYCESVGKLFNAKVKGKFPCTWELITSTRAVTK